MQDIAGHLLMKQLLKREADAQKEGGGKSTAAENGHDSGSGSGNSAPCFADALLEQAGEELPAWASKNRGAFVVAALEEVPSSSAGVRKVLGANPVKARLIKDAKEGPSVGVKVGVPDGQGLRGLSPRGLPNT